MININISLPRKIEDWLREETKKDGNDIEFEIVYFLAKQMCIEKEKEQYEK